MGKLNYKLKSATLIEALVAIIIVMLAFVMAIYIYTGVMFSDNGFQKLKAVSTIRKIEADAKENDNYIEGKISLDSITYVKTVNKFKGINWAVVYSVKAKDCNGKKLATYNEIISH